VFLYVYKCDCGATYETQSCGKNHCKGKHKKLMQTISRDFPKTVGNAHVTTYSRALAIDPSQVEEAMAAHPDEIYRVNEKEGIAMMEIRSARHQAEMAKRYGLVDWSGTKVSR
jgi:hypothetical protein